MSSRSKELGHFVLRCSITVTLSCPTFDFPFNTQSRVFAIDVCTAMAPDVQKPYSHARGSDSWEGSSKELDTDFSDDSSETHLIPKHTSKNNHRRSWLFVSVSCSLNVVLLFMTIYLSTQIQKTGSSSRDVGYSTDFRKHLTRNHTYRVDILTLNRTFTAPDRIRGSSLHRWTGIR